MKKLAADIKKTAKGINRFSAYLMIYGGIIVITLWAAALFLYIYKGEIAGYYECAELSSQLFDCGKDCLGASFVPALMLENIKMLVKSEGRK